MTAYAFGTGTLIAKRTDVVNTPPFLFGVLQDVSLDFDQKLESLVGQNKVAVALGDGELKITGKAKFARLQMTAFNNLLFGQTAATATGLQMTATGESGTIPTTPFQVTVTNSARTPLEDFGVFFQATGIQLTPVASGPTTGQYAFNAATGVYTFAAADTGLLVWLYYTYTPTSINDIVYANPLMGTSPIFEIFFKSTTSNFGVAKDVTIKLNACKSAKLNLGFANQKFVIPEFDFQAMADASGNVFTLSMTE
jgi:hypothetical protein